MSAQGGMALTRKNVFSQSWPIMLANAAAPIVGLVDTFVIGRYSTCLLYTSPSPRDATLSRMPSSA